MEKLASERICTNGASNRMALLQADRRRSQNAFVGALVVAVLFICSAMLVRDNHPWAGAGFFVTGLVIWLSVAYDRPTPRA